jgi:hypothetical protein
MHKALRFYIANAGFKLAWYDGQLLPFTDLGTGAPAHTILNLVNQGGKTTLLALLLSIFDPAKNRFLQTMSTPAHTFDDYFDKQGLPGIMAIEWHTPGDLVTPVRPLVTGQIVCMKKTGDGLEPERWFFYFYANQDLRLESLPGPNLEGSKLRVCANYDDVRRWMKETRDAHSGNFDFIQGQTEWRSMLESLGLDVEMIKQQVDFNKREGAMDESFLDFKTEHDFVRRFLSLALDATKADSVRELVATHCRRMARRKPLQEALGQLTRLDAVFGPFAEAAVAHATAKDVFATAERRIAAARATLAARAEGRRTDAQRASELASVQEAVASQAGTEKLANDKDAEAYTAEVKRRQRVTAVATRDAAKKQLAECRRFVRLLSAAQLQGEIDAAQAAVAQFDQSIELANQNEVLPLRNELGQCAAEYAYALDQATREKSAWKSAEEGKRRDLDAKLLGVRTKESELQAQVGSLREAAGKAKNFIEVAQTQRARLVREGSLVEAVDAPLALKAVEAQQAAHKTRVHEIEEAANQAGASERQATKLVGELATAQALASAQQGVLQSTIKEGDDILNKLRGLRIIRRAASSEAPEMDSEVLPSRLTQLIEQLRQQHNAARVELARLEEARTSIEYTRLAGQDPDVAKVVRALADAGVKNVRSHASYVAEVVPDEKLARQVATSDPARFLGVAVNTPAQLEEAKTALSTDLHLARPVQVSVATDKSQPTNATAFVVPGDDALYHFAAAQRRLLSIAPDEERATRQAQTLQDQLDEASEAKHELDDYRGRFGDGKLTTLRGQLEAIDGSLREVARKIMESKVDIVRFQSEEAAHRTAAAQTRTQIARLDMVAGNLRGYIEQFESHLPARNLELLQHTKQVEELGLALAELGNTKTDLEAQRLNVVDLINSLANDIQALSKTRGDVAYVDANHDAAEALRMAPRPLETLKVTYEGAASALKAVEEEKTGPLVAERKARREELGRHRARWDQDFKDIADAELQGLVGVDYARESGIASEAVRSAEAVHDKAVREEGAANRAEEDFQKGRVYKGHTIAGVELLTDGELAFALETARNLYVRSAEQEATALVESGKAKKDADRLATAARQLEDSAKHLAGLVPEDADMGVDDETLFPVGSEVSDVCEKLGRGLNTARSAVEKSKEVANRWHDQVRSIAAEDTFEKTDLALAMAIRANTLDTAMNDHARISRALADRKAAVQSELETMHADFNRAAEELHGLVDTALRVLRRATETLALPESAPIVGGLTVLKMPKTVSHMGPGERKDRLRPYLEELIADGNIPETGAALTTFAVMRLGHGHLGLRILKIVADKDEQYILVDRMSHSGAEKIAMALFLYFVIARLRYEQRAHAKKAEGGVLFLDNPFAKATARPIWQAIVGLADSMGVQLIITTGIKEYEALSVFKRFIRLAPGQENRTNSRRHIRVVDYQFRPEAEHKELTE